MRKLFPRFKFTLATISLIFMNLIPLAGVFWFGWEVGIIIFLYWLENVVIGVLNIIKIMACQTTLPFISYRPSSRSKIRAANEDLWSTDIIFIPAFFVFHYGLFCVGHYVALKETFENFPELSEILSTLLSPILFWSLLGLTLSHIISMVVNYFGKREYINRLPNNQMGAPYPRILLLHFVIILSATLAVKLGEGLEVLVVLVITKIIFDLAAHLIEHAKAKRQTAPLAD